MAEASAWERASNAKRLAAIQRDDDVNDMRRYLLRQFWAGEITRDECIARSMQVAKALFERRGSDLQRKYLQHRSDGLIHVQAVEAIALETDMPMATVLAQLEQQNALDEDDGIAPRNWRKPRRRALKTFRNSDA